MSDDERARLIAKIRALGAKAAATEFEAERRAFQSKAAALIAEHEVRRAELNEDITHESVGSIRKRYYLGNASSGAFILFANVAELYGCAAVGWVGKVLARDGDQEDGRPLRNAKGSYYRATCFSLTLFGRESDRDTVLALVETLLLPQMMRDVAAAKPKSRVSFCYAWTQAVGERLRASRCEVMEEAGRSAVIPVDPELESAVQDATNGRETAEPDVDLGSFAEGGLNGKRADIGGAKITTPTGPAQIEAGS